MTPQKEFRNEQSVLTWTGTKASARKMEDDINFIDGGRYATVEVENIANDYEGVTLGVVAHVDTLSTSFLINSGDRIQKADGLWMKSVLVKERQQAQEYELERHAEKQGVSYADAWEYFRDLDYDMSRVTSP